MKRYICSIFLSVSLLLAHAYDLEADGFYYNIVDFNSKTCELAKAVDQDIETLTAHSSVVIGGNTWSVVGIADNAFHYSVYLKSVEVEEGVTYIGKNAFDRCYQLSSVKLPASVTDIKMFAFKDSRITDLTIAPQSGDKKLTIGQSAFEGCKLSILHLTNVTSVAYRAFAANSFLTTVYFDDIDFPSILIEHESFAYDDAIKTVVIPSPNPPILGVNAFPTKTKLLASFIIPMGTKDYYLTNNEWHDYKYWKDYADCLIESDVFTGYDTYCVSYQCDDSFMSNNLWVNGNPIELTNEDGIILPGAYFRPGERVAFSVAPYDGYSISWAAINTADLNSFEITSDLQPGKEYVIDAIDSSVTVVVCVEPSKPVEDKIEDIYSCNKAIYVNPQGLTSDKPFKGLNILHDSNSQSTKMIYRK